MQKIKYIAILIMSVYSMWHERDSIKYNISLSKISIFVASSLSSLSLSKTRLSVRNGFLVNGNYLEISATESPGTCAVDVVACSTPPQSHTFRGLTTLHTALTVIRANYSHEKVRIKLRIHSELSRSILIHDEIITKDMEKRKKQKMRDIR